MDLVIITHEVTSTMIKSLHPVTKILGNLLIKYQQECLRAPFSSSQLGRPFQ